jgi:sialate O-acetylesterase
MITSSWRWLAALIGVVLAIAVNGARGEVKPHALLAENAVLQQQLDLPVWGTAAQEEKVTVEFQDQKLSTTAAADGKWRVVLKPMTASETPYTMTITGSATQQPIVLKNVVVGEVWLVSGQSNMAMGVGKLRDAKDIEEKSVDPMLRYFYVPWNATDEVQHDVKPGDGGAGHWNAANAYYTHMFPAVGYFFGRDLRASRKVPIGLINSCVGGSYADTWIPRKVLESDPVLFKPALERWGIYVKNVNAAIEQYKKAEPELMKKWEEEAAKAKAEGKKEPPKPQPPQDPEKDPRCKTAGIYNAMIAPLQPYAIRGAAWYQGENDAGDAFRYRSVLPIMIKSWRDTWGQGDFPFLIVQLPAYGGTPKEPADSAWAETREAQVLTSQKVPGVTTVCSIDCGDVSEHTNLHPPNKAPIGARLALAAQAVVYGEKVEWSGPQFESVKFDGDKAAITFTHVGGGLATSDGARAQRLRRRRRGSQVRLGDRGDPWRRGDRLQPAGGQAHRRAIRLGRLARMQSGEQSRLARRAVPHG